MAVTAFQDSALADRQRERDGGAAEQPVRSHLATYCATMDDEPPWHD